MLTVLFWTVMTGFVVWMAYIIGKDTGTYRAQEGWIEESNQMKHNLTVRDNRINQKQKLKEFAQEDALKYRLRCAILTDLLTLNGVEVPE